MSRGRATGSQCRRTRMSSYPMPRFRRSPNPDCIRRVQSCSVRRDAHASVSPDRHASRFRLNSMMRGRPPVTQSFGTAKSGSSCPWQDCQARPARLALQGQVIGEQVDPSWWRREHLVGAVTTLATVSPATGPGWRALGRAGQVGRRRNGRVPLILSQPGFQIPSAFVQLDDHCPLLGNCHPEHTNQSLQGSDHGWHQSLERSPTLYPVKRLRIYATFRSPINEIDDLDVISHERLTRGSRRSIKFHGVHLRTAQNSKIERYLIGWNFSVA
jgi:hypothetical protein